MGLACGADRADGCADGDDVGDNGGGLLSGWAVVDCGWASSDSGVLCGQDGRGGHLRELA